MVDDENFRVHHPSCRVTRPIRCIAATSEDSDATQSVCGKDASFWNKSNNLCYCAVHQAGISGLQPISAMTKEVVAEVLAQQKKVLG